MGDQDAQPPDLGAVPQLEVDGDTEEGGFHGPIPPLTSLDAILAFWRRATWKEPA